VLPFFSAWIGQPYNFPITFENILIIFGFIIFVSAASGIYPAISISSFNPITSLKGNFSQSQRGSMIRKSLIIFQFTITIALIASMLIITKQMNFIKNKSLGFNGSGVIEIGFNGNEKVIQRYTLLRNEWLDNAYILNVTKHGANVVGGLGNGWTTTRNLKGEEVSSSIYRLFVDADYFTTYSIKLASGRFFSKKIPTDSSKAVLVNEAAVRSFGWQKAEYALGKPFGNGNDTKYVIGVVKDFNFESLHKPVDPLLISYAFGGITNSISLKVDRRHLTEAIGYIIKTWRKVAPDVPLQYSFIDDKIAEQYGGEQKMERIFYAFACLSLIIACFGLVGLSTFVVESKVKEIGIRKVLGASVIGIVFLLSRDFVRLVVLSILIAVPLAWYFTNKWLQNFAYKVTIDWQIFFASGLIAVVIALITVSFQSIKAATTNPVNGLRTE
jgi:putative ABC transport system permease protein